MKWGSRYGPSFVNRLFKSIKRHTTRDTRLICFTDDNTDIDLQIQCKKLPTINLPQKISYTPWRKISIWQYPLL